MATNYPLITIIYDSITNPVFASQVLARAQRATQRPHVLISFERTTLPTDHPVYHQWPGPIHIIRNPLPFIGRPTLAFLLPSLKKVLAHYPRYEIIARGPHAGWLALHALTTSCTSICIQARGLLAAEYAYVHQQESRLLWKAIHAMRSRWYTTLEHVTYTAAASIPFTLEAVSPALRDYLQQEYQVATSRITIAQEDIPAHLSPEEKVYWRSAIREQLNIPHESTVYCYSGSAKPWQCPAQMVAYFLEQFHEKTPKPYLLLLTQDRPAFLPYLEQVPTSFVRIVEVPSHEVVQYLAAADKGLLFREKHIMNWVSRPTKALEYQAAGLAVVHNNTVGWLAQTGMEQGVVSEIFLPIEGG